MNPPQKTEERDNILASANMHGPKSYKELNGGGGIRIILLNGRRERLYN